MLVELGVSRGEAPVQVGKSTLGKGKLPHEDAAALSLERGAAITTVIRRTSPPQEKFCSL